MNVSNEFNDHLTAEAMAEEGDKAKSDGMPEIPAKTEEYIKAVKTV